MAYRQKKGGKLEAKYSARAELANTLLNAVRQNNKRKALELIKKGADVNFTFSNGKTVLLHAIFYDSRIISVLIDAGADVNATDDAGKTTLMYCALAQYAPDNKRMRAMHGSSYDCEKSVSKLIQKRADVNTKDENGKTALIYAIQNNNEIVAVELIKAGADLKVKDNQGMTALMYAAQTCGARVVATLLNAGDDVNKVDNKGRTALMHHTLMGTKKRVHWIYHEEFDTDVNVAQILIKADSNINATDYQGKTALNYSLEYNNKHLACALIEAGADVNVVDGHAKTSLLLYSSRIGNKGVVQQLVKTGVDINITDENRKSALIYAVENDNNHLAQEIIDAGADVNITDYEGKSVLMYALESDDTHLAHAILDAGADVNITDKEGKAVLMYFAQYGNNRRAKLRTRVSTSNVRDEEALITNKLIKSVGNIDIMDCHSKTALMYAVQYDNTAIACALIDAGADHSVIDEEGKSALFFAVIAGNEGVVQRLIKAGTDLNITDNQGMTALMHAVQRNEKNIACALLDAGADYNVTDDDRQSALFFAAIRGNESVVQRLIKAGADLNITDNQCMTALMHAVQNSRTSVVDELLNAGADVNKVDNRGGTALTYCAQNQDNRDFNIWDELVLERYVDLEETAASDQKITSKLIKAGADVNITDSQGKTSLIHAVENNRANVVAELIDAGADVNIPDHEGRTALMNCAQSGKKRREHSLYERRYLEDHETIEIPERSIITKLTQSKADMNMTDDQGKTALMHAVLNNNESMACALLDAGADYSVIDDDGKSALFYAVIDGNESVVKKLVKAGTAIDITDNQGMTALMHAVRNVRAIVVDELIDAGVDVNMTDDKGRTALIHYALNGAQRFPAIVYQMYMHRYHKLDSLNSIAIALIKAGADINISDDQEKTALMYALQKCNEILAHQLLDAGANVRKLDNQGKSALSYCFQSDFLTSALVEIDPLTDDIFDRYEVMEKTSESVSCKLIKAGADVNLIDDEGKTPLMYAVHYDSKSLVNALIEAGANLNVTDVKGRTALVHSLQDHHESLALILIKAGADVNTSDHEGQTALFYSLDHEKIVHALIEDGHASVKKKDRYGRSVLFYSFTKSVTVTNYLLEKGGNLNLKDNCSMNIISFFVEHLMSKGKMSSFDSFMSKLNPLYRKRINPQTIFEAIVNSVFCKIFHCMVQDHDQDQDSDVESLIQALDLSNQYIAGQSVKEKKIIEEVLVEIRGGNISRVIELLIQLGANPNYADADGNTALHYATCLPLFGIHRDNVVMTVCQKLEDLGVSFNAKNHKNETPLLFCLSKKEWITTSKGSSKINTLVEVCKFLLENGSNIEETTKGEKSVFHLILELFQEGLHLNDKRIGKEVLAETVKLLELFPCSRTLTSVAVNKRDANHNSPIHLWAMLELHLSSKNDSSDVEHNTLKKNILGTISKHLLACGVNLNGRNKSDEMPLHLCRSWTAVKLLIDAGANPKVLDLEGHSPLLVASKNISLRDGDRLPPRLLRRRHLQLLLDKFNDHLYQDVSQEPKEFWKTVLDHNLDPWSVDNHGISVLSILIRKKAFDLSKALVEVACEKGYIQSDTIAVLLLNAVCQDSSTRKQWKSILVEMILNSRKANLISFASSEDTALHLCCRNIVKPSEEAFSDEEKILYYNNANTSVNSAKTSVHWTIVKQLLTYGTDCNALDASGQSCLDIAKKCSSLKSLLLKPLDIDEVPLAFPWTSISTKYKPILSKVARRQECKCIDTYWYHETNIQKGSFGLVFAGMNEKDGREVAIKRIEKLRSQQLEADKKEIKNLTVLADCEQVVRYWSFTEDEHFCYVVLELMEGNLNEYLGGATFDDTKSVQLCDDMLNGLKYLHQQNILHRDLKPSNILFKTYPKLCLKIADFGLSRRIDTLGTYTTSSGSVVGTRCWIAPEVFKCSSKKHKHQMASDVFSAGLVLYYILSGKKHPFSPADCENKSELQINHETEANVIHDKMESFNDSTLCPEATDLMHNMLDSDPTKRLTAAMALTHPFFWPEKKKMDFLSAVGNQPEFECPRANLHKRTLPLSMVENELDDKLKAMIIEHHTWDDAKYVHMPDIYKEMMQKRKPYNTNSVVELVRFIRNTLAHVSDDKRPTLVKKLVLEDFVFLEYFPNLVMEVFKCVKIQGWDSREEIKYRIEQ